MAVAINWDFGPGHVLTKKDKKMITEVHDALERNIKNKEIVLMSGNKDKSLVIKIIRPLTKEDRRKINELGEQRRRDAEDFQNRKKAREREERYQAFITARIAAGFTEAQAKDLWFLFSEVAPKHHDH